MLRPMSVSPRPSGPWHWAQDPRNTSCPWLTTSSVAGSGFFFIPASNGMATSLAALARLVSPWEGGLSAVQPESKAPSIALTRVSLCFDATLRWFPRHEPIHGEPANSLLSSAIVCPPSLKPDLTRAWDDCNQTKGEGAKQLDEGIDRYLSIDCAGRRCLEAGFRMTEEPASSSSRSCLCANEIRHDFPRGNLRCSEIPVKPEVR